MLELKLGIWCVFIVLMYYVSVSESGGNYTIGFEGYGGSNNKPRPTNPPRPNPTYRPSSSRPNPTYRPSSPKPNPTYRPISSTKRPSSPKPTYHPQPNPTYRPQPNPTYRPQPNPTYRPPSSKLNVTYWPPKTNTPSKTTPKPFIRKTTPRPTEAPRPTSPPLWNIWTSSYVPPSTSTVPVSTKIPTNTFKSDPTLLGLYTIMRNVVGVTLSQTGQSKPVRKPLHSSYYYAVYHYNKNREKVSSKILIPYDSVGYCEAGTSDRSCVPGTYALCTLDWTIMCITYSSATFPCYFNTSLQCATGKVPCDSSRDINCAAMGNQIEVQTPCISNIVVTSPTTIFGSITQTGAPDPYAKVVSGPIDLCATTILEIKKLESPVGSLVELFSEVGKLHVDYFNNFNVSQPVQTATLSPIVVPRSP